MTDATALPTEAGYELDVLVLERVMGGRIVTGRSLGGYWVEHPGLAPRAGDSGPICETPEQAVAAAGCQFSRADRAAMRVVDRMIERGWYATLKAFDGVWEAEFWGPGPFQVARHAVWRVAACLAAVRAVEAQT